MTWFRKQSGKSAELEPLRKWSGAWLWVLLFLLAAPAFQHLHAQQLGGINGTITDTTGAVIPGAKVVVVMPSSGVTYTSTTGSAGTFLLVNVIPGSYVITVQATGFERFVQKDFRVDIGATAALMASLKPGSASATVEVSAAATPLLTQTPDIGTTIEPQILNDMPLKVNGGMRDIRTVALSNIPGVRFDNYGYGWIGGSPNGAEFNYFNGLPQNSNATMTPPYDFVNEVHVDTTSMDAQDGWAIGAVDFQTKFGTNELHGSAFEINRNNFFDSRGPFNPAPLPVPPDHENDYGFSVGGPVWIPKVYNGHDKTFFFFSWEGFTQNNQATGGQSSGYTTVPTKAMKQGDFSGLMTYDANANVVQAPIYNTIPALGGDPNNPTQFSCDGNANVICQSDMSATALALIKYLPDPNTTGKGPGNLQDNYYYNVPIHQSTHRWGLSLDEHFSDTKSMNVAITQSPSPQIAAYNGAPIFGGPGSTNPLSDLLEQDWPSGFVYGNYVWAIHPSLIFTAGASIPFDYNYVRKGLESSMTIPAQNFTGAPATGFPTITFSGIDQPQNFGKGSGILGWDLKRPYYAYHADLDWTKARHNFTFGGQGMMYMQYGFNCGNCAGTFAFLGATTDNYVNGASGPSLNPYAGSPFASFMIGEADNAGLSYSPSTNIKYSSWGFYIQDAFKYTPKLTLNYGLRWDIQVPLSTNNGKEDFVTPKSLLVANAAASGQPGVLTHYGMCTTDCAGFNRAAIHWGEVGPRFGFSYAVNHQTVIGGGASVLWQQTNSFENSLGYNNDGNAFGVANYINGTGTNVPGFGNWDTAKLNFPPPAPFKNTALAGQSVGYFDPEVAGRNPYYFLWNFGIQRTLPHNWFIRSSYIGQRGVHMASTPQDMNLLPEGTPQHYGNMLKDGITSQAALNAGISAPFANFAQLMGSSATVAQALKPFPQYTGIYNNYESFGEMSYNAWQTEIDKRYSGGLSLLSAFTLQREITNAGDLEGWEGATGKAVDPYNPSTAFAPTGPVWLTNIAGTYDLPVGLGRRWFNNQHLTGELIGGWKLSWGLYYGSGSPHGVSAYGNPFGNGNMASRIATTPIKLNGNYTHTIKKWVEAGASAAAAPTIIQNNGAFMDPAVAAGFSINSPQWQFIPGTSKASYGEFRDPVYANEQVGMMKEFSATERAKVIFRVDYFNPLNRWYIPWAVDMNINDGAYGRVTSPHPGGGQRQGQATLRIDF